MVDWLTLTRKGIRRISLLTVSWLVCSALLGGPIAHLRLVASGIENLVTVAHPEPGQILAVEIAGTIRVVRDGKLLAKPFLDLRGQVDAILEGGLIGLAIHPRFSENRRFFVSYTRQVGSQFKLIISEFLRLGFNPDRAGTLEKVILEVDQLSPIHQAGDLAFGPDGYLYISLGDGGPLAGQNNQAQDLRSLLGKILRIDIDSEVQPYGIPEDNPFFGQEGSRDEIWAYGFRNPFRMSFDSVSGRLFVGDVGENTFEEINIVERGGNYGWDVTEGNQCFPESVTNCEIQDLIFPIFQYGREESAQLAVIGGAVYRGQQRTPLWGDYLFAEFVSGRIWALTERYSGHWERREVGRLTLPVHFSVDKQGELYVAELLSGELYRVDFGWREVLPHLVSWESPGGSLGTTVLVINPEKNVVSGTLKLFSSDGSPAESEMADPSGGQSFTLPPGSALRLPLQLDQGFNGWGVIESDTPVKVGVTYHSKTETEQTLTEASLDANPVATRFTTHLRLEPTVDRDAGLAVSNPFSGHQVEINIHADGKDGSSASHQFELEPLQKTAFFLSTIEGLSQNFEGTVSVTANREIALALIETLGGIPVSGITVSTGQVVNDATESSPTG